MTARLLILFVCLTLASACATQAPAPDEAKLPVNPVAASLSQTNRLDRALAAAAQGWRFSALFTAGDRRVPLLILVRAQDLQGAPGLEAMLLTETSLGLCSLAITSSSVSVDTRLPDSRITAMCERTGTALQRLILAPQPQETDRVLDTTARAPQGLVDPNDHTLKTVLWRRQDGDNLAFAFPRAGGMAEKRALRNDDLQWRAMYTDHNNEGGLYIPRNWRYVEPFWNLRMVMLPPQGTTNGQDQR